MSDIFISYNREDRERAKIIAEALEQEGYSIWWDRIIPPGKKFVEVIEEELDASKCVIVLWSHKSILSDWVKEEASEGLRRKILIPILIDDVEIPLGFRRIQTANLIDWQGILPYYEYDLLLKSIKEILGKQFVTKIDINKTSKDEEGVQQTEKLTRERINLDLVRLSYIIAILAFLFLILLELLPIFLGIGLPVFLKYIIYLIFISLIIFNLVRLGYIIVILVFPFLILLELLPIFGIGLPAFLRYIKYFIFASFIIFIVFKAKKETFRKKIK